MKTAIKIAWREARASHAKFLFVILAVAAGVACLTGVKGFTRVFQTMLSREARTLMAGDLMVRTFSLPTPDQQALFDRLQRKIRAHGIDRTAACCELVDNFIQIIAPGGRVEIGGRRSASVRAHRSPAAR